MSNSALIDRQAHLFGRYRSEGLDGLRHVGEIVQIGQELERRTRWSAIYEKLGKRYQRQ